jgi:hypothetical protein
LATVLGILVEKEIISKIWDKNIKSIVLFRKSIWSMLKARSPKIALQLLINTITILKNRSIIIEDKIMIISSFKKNLFKGKDSWINNKG